MNVCRALKKMKLVCILGFVVCGFVPQWGCVSRTGSSSSAGDVRIEICVPDSRAYPSQTTFVKTNVHVGNQPDVRKVLNTLEFDSKPFNEDKRIFLGFETAQVFERNGVPYMISMICANGHVCVLRELDVYKSDMGYVLYGFKRREEYDSPIYYQLFHDYFKTAVDSDPAGTLGACKGRARCNLIRSIMQGEDMRKTMKRQVGGGLRCLDVVQMAC